MKLAKLSLLASAIGFAGFGIVLFIAPHLLERVGVAIMNPAGSIELRAFYGGIEVGLTAFFILAFKKEWILPGLTVQIATTGFIVFFRIASIVIENFNANPHIYWAMLAEGSLLILGIVALSLYKKKN